MITAMRDHMRKDRVACFGHILHNAVMYSLIGKEEVKLAISSCKRFVSSFSCSFKKQRDLVTAQNDLNMPVKALMNESPTRWNSRYEMIKRVLLNEQPLRVVLSCRQYQHLLPSAAQFTILELIQKALEPFSFMTDLLSGNKDTTISSVIPLVEQIKKLCQPKPDATLNRNLIREKIKGYILPRVGYMWTMMNSKWMIPPSVSMLTVHTWIQDIEIHTSQIKIKK